MTMSDLTKFIQDCIEVAENEREKANGDQALSEYLTGKIDALWIVLRKIQPNGKARQFPSFRKVRVTRGTWAGAVGSIVDAANNRLLVKIGGALVWLSRQAVEIDAEK
jgi:hypothetical protein